MANFLDDYEPVEDRLRDFWSEHPDGRIDTDLVQALGGDYIVKASVWRQTYVSDHRPQDRPDATGLAHDSVDQLPPNMKASALEVCETSAIGRALANLGYAAKGKRPSREEMSKASAEGEAAVEEPGEGVSTSLSPSPGSTKYAVDPTACDHKRKSGADAKVTDAEKVERCSKCGLPWIVVVEGTTADLGSA